MCTISLHTEFAFSYCTEFAEWSEFVEQDSASEYHKNPRLLYSRWIKVSCLWVHGEWFSGISIAWYIFINVDSEKREIYLVFGEFNQYIIFSLVLTIVGPTRGSSLTWYIRLRIAIDVARWVCESYSAKVVNTRIPLVFIYDDWYTYFFC